MCGFMEHIASEKVIRPVGWYRWMICIILTCFWILPGLIAIPNMNLQLASLVIAEVLWLALCLYLCAIALSWFRVEITDAGIIRRGIVRNVCIRWSEAAIHRRGQLIVVSSSQGSIRINPVIYRSQGELEKFISQHRGKHPLG
jgi:hypothetical protein